MGRAPLLVVALTLTACTTSRAPAEESNPSTLSPAGEITTVGANVQEPAILDPEGLVVASEFSFDVQQTGINQLLDEGAVVDSPREGWDLRVGWAALPCQQAPLVIVSKEEGQLLIRLEKGPQITPGDVECDSREAHHMLDLELEEHVRSLEPAITVE